MKAIGLGHRTRERIGLLRITTANGIMRATGREAVAVSNTTTTGITVETVTSKIMTDMAIMTMAGTRDSCNITSEREGLPMVWQALFFLGGIEKNQQNGSSAARVEN